MFSMHLATVLWCDFASDFVLGWAKTSQDFSVIKFVAMGCVTGTQFLAEEGFFSSPP
jgi:hypothetical protein